MICKCITQLNRFTHKLKAKINYTLKKCSVVTVSLQLIYILPKKVINYGFVKIKTIRKLVNNFV